MRLVFDQGKHYNTMHAMYAIALSVLADAVRDVASLDAAEAVARHRLAGWPIHRGGSHIAIHSPAAPRMRVAMIVAGVGVSARRIRLSGPGGLLLTLDPAAVHPDEPGADTPALISLPFGRGTGTFWRVLDQGVVDGRDAEDVALTDRQNGWVDLIADAVGDWLRHHCNAIQARGRQAHLGLA